MERRDNSSNTLPVIMRKLQQIERIWTLGGAHPKFHYLDAPLTAGRKVLTTTSTKDYIYLNKQFLITVTNATLFLLFIS